MRRLLPAFVLLALAVPAHATWSLTQSVTNGSCSIGSAACNVTISALGAGHLLLAVVDIDPADNVLTPFFSLNQGCASWQIAPTGSTLFFAGTGNITRFAYCLSSTTGGGTTFTVTLVSTPMTGTWAVALWEWATTAGGFALDAFTRSNDIACSGTNCASPNLTLTGTNDVLAAFAMADATGSITAVASPYGDLQAITGDYSTAGIGDHLNTGSGTGATFTNSTSGGQFCSITWAFKETGSTPVRMPSRVF